MKVEVAVLAVSDSPCGLCGDIFVANEMLNGGPQQRQETPGGGQQKAQEMLGQLGDGQQTGPQKQSQ